MVSWTVFSNDYDLICRFNFLSSPFVHRYFTNRCRIFVFVLKSLVNWRIDACTKTSTIVNSIGENTVCVGLRLFVVWRVFDIGGIVCLDWYGRRRFLFCFGVSIKWWQCCYNADNAKHTCIFMVSLCGLERHSMISPPNVRGTVMLSKIKM